MEKVRAKFKCNTVLNAEHYKEVNLSPVYDAGGKDHENRKFWEATPAGELKMQISNLPAAEMFVPGDEYYLDFTKAE